MSQDKLPRQLKWSVFVCVIKHLGYAQMPSGSGSARSFPHALRKPTVVTFHEPHREPLRHGSVREYLRKLEIIKEEFLVLLKNCH